MACSAPSRLGHLLNAQHLERPELCMSDCVWQQQNTRGPLHNMICGDADAGFMHPVCFHMVMAIFVFSSVCNRMCLKCAHAAHHHPCTHEHAGCVLYFSLSAQLVLVLESLDTS